MTLDVVDKITVKVSYKKFFLKKNIILSEGIYYKTKHGHVKLEMILLNDNNISDLMISHMEEDLMLISEFVILDEFLALFGIMPGEYHYDINKNCILRISDYDNNDNITIDLKINDYVAYKIIDNKGRVIFYGNGQIRDMWNINNHVSACIIGAMEFHFTATGLMIDNSLSVINKYDDERKLKIIKIMES